MAPYLLITGQTRDPEIFRICWGKYLEMLEGGAVEKIIISTWENEAEIVKKHIPTKMAGKIEILALKQTTLPSPGTLFPQMRMLEAGCAYIEEDRFILKSRFDVFLDFDEMSKSLKHFRGFPPVAGPNKVQTDRIWSPFCSLVTPFWLGDVIYMGRGCDLRRFITYEYAYDVLDHEFFDSFGWVEIRMWGSYLQKNYGIFREIHTALPFMFYFNRDLDWMRECMSFDIYWEYVGSWMLYIYRNMCIGKPFYNGRVHILRSHKDGAFTGSNQRLGQVIADDVEDAFTNKLNQYKDFLATDDMAWFENIFGDNTSHLDGDFLRRLRKGARMLDHYDGGAERSHRLAAITGLIAQKRRNLGLSVPNTSGLTPLSA